MIQDPGPQTAPECLCDHPIVVFHVGLAKPSCRDGWNSLRLREARQNPGDKVDLDWLEYKVALLEIFDAGLMCISVTTVDSYNTRSHKSSLLVQTKR